MPLSLKDLVYVFTDLDDTLFQTRCKCPSLSRLFHAAMDRNGQPLSYFTPQQKTLLRLLEQGTIIPVTGRNTTALERVHLKFAGYRITSHGAMLMGPDGVPDEAWWQLIYNEHKLWIQPMEAILARIGYVVARNDLVLRCRIIEDQGIPVYVSIKGDEAALDRMADMIFETWNIDGAQVHRNGQNMALLPSFASKERAVKFLMERLMEDGEELLFIGIGDSLTDLPFLRLCHYVVTPRHSQIQAMT